MCQAEHCPGQRWVLRLWSWKVNVTLRLWSHKVSVTVRSRSRSRSQLTITMSRGVQDHDNRKLHLGWGQSHVQVQVKVTARSQWGHGHNVMMRSRWWDLYLNNPLAESWYVCNTLQVLPVGVAINLKICLQKRTYAIILSTVGGYLQQSCEFETPGHLWTPRKIIKMCYS